jgi:hypothetical protein
MIFFLDIVSFKADKGLRKIIVKPIANERPFEWTQIKYGCRKASRYSSRT